MPLYDYRGIDDYGKEHRGQLKAENEKDLEKKLAEKGYYLLEAKEVRAIVKASRPIKAKKAIPIEEDVPPGFRNTVTEGAKEVHLHQHIHQAPEPPKPSYLDLVAGILALVVSGLFFFSIFCLIIYLFSPTKSKMPSSPTQAIQTKSMSSTLSSTQKEYISRATSYLNTLNEYDIQIVEIGAEVNRGKTTLNGNDVKKMIEKAKYVEDASWLGDYQNYGKLIVPSSCFSLDAKIKKCRQLHNSALQEMLDVCKEKYVSNAQIENGVHTFELAILMTNECIDDLNILLQSL